MTEEERTALLDTSNPPLLISDDYALPPLDESESLSAAPNHGNFSGPGRSEEFVDASFIMSPRAGVLGLMSRDYTYYIWGQRTEVRGLIRIKAWSSQLGRV